MGRCIAAIEPASDVPSTDYGLKIHRMVTHDGYPVEFFLTPGSYSDTVGLQGFDFALPEGAWVFGDKAYNPYEIEDVLAEAGICLLPVP